MSLENIQIKRHFSVAQVLVFTMLKHGMTIAEIAQGAKVSYITVYRWVKGAKPQFFSFQRLISLYAVTVCKN